MTSSNRNDPDVWILIQAKRSTSRCSKLHLFKGAAVSDVYLMAIDHDRVRTECRNAVLKHFEAEPHLLTTNYDTILDAALYTVPHHGSASAIMGPKAESSIKVPSAAETLLTYVTSPEHVHAILGDLQELFEKRAEHFGLQAARRWYWWQVTRTIGAFLGESLKVVSIIQSFLSKIGL